MGLQQMATPRAGDNRVAAQMDGRHVHNAVAALQRWMGAGKDLAEKPATWTFRLAGGSKARFQGLRPSARHGSRSRPAGLMVRMKKKTRFKLFIGSFGFVNGRMNICI